MFFIKELDVEEVFEDRVIIGFEFELNCEVILE